MILLDEYKNLIDELVSSSSSVGSVWAKNGAFPDTKDNSNINAFLSDLNAQQRQILSELISEAKKSGVHDALVVLNEKQHLNGLRISINDQALPLEPFGTELQYDFISRVEGDDWPEV